MSGANRLEQSEETQIITSGMVSQAVICRDDPRSSMITTSGTVSQAVICCDDPWYSVICRDNPLHSMIDSAFPGTANHISPNRQCCGGFMCQFIVVVHRRHRFTQSKLT